VQFRQKMCWYKFLPALLIMLLFAGMFSLLAPEDAFAEGGALEITGPGLNGEITITQEQLRGTGELPDGITFARHDEWYSTINTWPTKSWYRGVGVKLTDLLDAAGGLKPEASLIKFIARDGFSATFTVQELIHEPRYRFPNFMSTGLPGHLPGDPSDAVPVEPIIAHKSFSAQDMEDVMGENASQYFSRTDANHLLYGQRAVTQQTNAGFVKHVTKIEVLTGQVEKWEPPTAEPEPGEVPVGTMIELRGPFDDEDKVHYTLDGSTPDIESPMYNWVAKRWWSSRQGELDEINRPIEITGDTTIKAFVTGPGRADSDIVTFEYTVPTAPNLTVSPAEVFVAADFCGEFVLTVENDTITRAVYKENLALQGVFAPLSIKNVTKTSAATVTAEVYGGLNQTGTGTIALAGNVLAVSENALTAAVTVKAAGNGGGPGNGGSGPGGDVILTITGDGVTTPGEFTRSQLEAMPQRQYVYSSINTWPTKRWYVGKGVKLRDLLEEAGMKSNARQIRFIAGDGYYTTLTVQELLRDKRYCFPNFKSSGSDADGHIPGSAAGATEVEPILALVSAAGTDNPAVMNDLNALLLMLGQRAVTEQTGPLFIKSVNSIVVSTSATGSWGAPTAEPDGGTVPAGTEVVLHSPKDDDDKVYYTTDGSTPTIESPMYNWVAKRWWPARGEEAVSGINRPIELTADTTIKAVTIGPGKSNSKVVTFTYKVTENTVAAGGNITPGKESKVSLGEEAVIEIPAGALAGTGPVEVKIERVVDPPAEPAGLKIVGGVYEFSVDGATSYNFEEAVTIKLSFDPGEVAPGETPAIYYYDETAKEWVALGGEVSGNIVTAQLDHFTKFTVMAAKKVPETDVVLNDIAGHWAEESIEELFALGAIAGYPDGNFKPDIEITRAEFVTILVKAFKLESLKGKVFADTAGHWAQENVATAVSHGIVNGYDADTFGPDDLITREQMAVMTVKAAQLAPVTEEILFADRAAISDWARTAVATAVHHGIVKGYPGNTVRPRDGATRAEAAAIIVNALPEPRAPAD